MLRAAVESLLAQEGLAVPAEVVVVDNDAHRSAEQIVQDLAQRGPLPVRYFCEVRAGISHARNAGVAASRGRYVAFLDDDEVACPRWLAALLWTAKRFDADIVVGPVVPRFADAAPIPRYAERAYNRDANVPTGEPVAWFKIGNALLHRARCLSADVPFDPRFGLSGGEDTILIAGLREQGRRLVWCAEAVVTEEIPEEKVAPAYLLRRAFRAGQTTAYLPATFARPKWGTVARRMAIGAGQACLYGPWSLFLRLLGREAWLAAMATAASGRGR
jgi:succinoglycan biosynthesis protein ExoM